MRGVNANTGVPLFSPQGDPAVRSRRAAPHGNGTVRFTGKQAAGILEERMNQHLPRAFPPA